MTLELPTPKTIGEALNEGKATIMSLKKFTDAGSIPDPLESTKLLCTMGYLIESGAYTPEVLLQTYRECITTGDFEKLAVMNTQFQIRQAQERLAQTTVETSADPLTPGRRELQGSLEMLEEALTDIGIIKIENGIVTFHAVESPSQSVTPLWAMAIQQSGKPIQEIWALLEKGEM